MSNADIEAYQKDSVTGHRPTWKAGANAWAHGTRHGMGHMGSHGPALLGPARVFLVALHQSRGGEQRRTLKPLELKSLESLNLSAGAARDEIKARFKELVKRHHPDANGGTKGPRTSCAKSSKLITISSRLAWSEACQPSSSE